ncbi:MAG: hypothetical protein HY438_02895 [DPANN group archaeon]|nr:hypothetical protein [DPANN group archaeon]
MAFLEGTLGVGVGLLLGLAFLKFSGYVDQLRKELGYFASGSVFLLLTPVLSEVADRVPSVTTAVGWINVVFAVIAFILVLIGAIAMAIQIFSRLK